LRSISEISGCVAAIPDTVSRIETIASISTPGWRRILHHFDQHAPQPHHYHRAESIVAVRPCQQFHARLRHRRHRNAFEARIAGACREIAANSLERIAHRNLTVEIQRDTAHLALVTHIRRQHFQRHRESKPRRRSHRVIGRQSGLRHYHRQAERMQDSLALDFRKNGSSTGTSRRY
jgi:hypothetical protein